MESTIFIAVLCIAVGILATTLIIGRNKNKPLYQKKETDKQKVEFSKKLLYVIFGVTGVIIVFTLSIIWRTGDTTPLAYLIPSIFVEVATATSFYYWKAKSENEIKLQSFYGKNIENEQEDVL